MRNNEEPPPEVDGIAVARLAGLIPGTEAEAAALATEARTLLGHFAALRDVDTHGVPPMTSPQVPDLRLREDDPAPPMDPSQVLANAALVRDGCFEVPSRPPGAADDAAGETRAR